MGKYRYPTVIRPHLQPNPNLRFTSPRAQRALVIDDVAITRAKITRKQIRTVNDIMFKRKKEKN
jgi:hypothetical protein